MRVRYAITAAALAVAVAVQATGAAAGSSSVDTARKVTKKYHSVAVAKSNGYGRLKDAAGIACIAQPGQGAMGIHYVKSGLVGDKLIDLKRPEALVYEPSKDGKLHLVALEYIVMQADWDATHSAPPRLFGQNFMLQASPNRFGLPAFYMLHAWIWKTNPSGKFMPWNPDVSCQYAR